MNLNELNEILDKSQAVMIDGLFEIEGDLGAEILNPPIPHMGPQLSVFNSDGASTMLPLNDDGSIPIECFEFFYDEYWHNEQGEVICPFCGNTGVVNEDLRLCERCKEHV
jgi:hypothetical protein